MLCSASGGPSHLRGELRELSRRPPNRDGHHQFQRTADLGAGILKVFSASPGKVLAIQLGVTNGYGGNYGLVIENLGSGGVTNNANRLTFTADTAWTSRAAGTYFTVGPVGTVPELWTFNLSIQSNPPLDAYVAQAQVAGSDSGANLWAQAESFYIEVVKAQPPIPVITGISRSGTSFTVQVTSVTGVTYFLEYKLTLSSASWQTAAQASGTGGVMPLTDSNANDEQRFYRIRAL